MGQFNRVAQDGVPSIGVVSAPALQRRWWAARGQGAFAVVDGGPPRLLSVSSVAQLGLASLSFSSLKGWAQRGLRDRFLELTDEVWRVLPTATFCLIASLPRERSISPDEPEVSVWDLAALDILGREAGGTLKGLDGTAGPHPR